MEFSIIRTNVYHHNQAIKKILVHILGFGWLTYGLTNIETLNLKDSQLDQYNHWVYLKTIFLDFINIINPIVDFYLLHAVEPKPIQLSPLLLRK